MPHLAGYGRCIYCGEPDGLTDEHIIPTALGGTLVLDQASCEACRVITSEFERRVTREMYWPLRLRLGLVGSRKHKHERPTHWPGVLVDEGGNEEDRPIEVGKFPRVYSVMEFAEPGLRSGSPPSEGNPEMKLHLKGDREEMAQFLSEAGAERGEFTQTLQWAPFARMIAKIGHAFAVSQVGLQGVEFLLPPIVRGTSAHISSVVGGVAIGKELSPGTDLAVATEEIGGRPYLVAYTTIFGNDRFPTYQAVVGPITDLLTIRAKMVRE